MGISLLSGGPTLGLGQEVTVPSSEAEWTSLRAQLEENPYLLAIADRETALSIVMAAFRTRGDGLLWAVYGPGICAVRSPDRAQMTRETRREAFGRSRECLGRILNELPSSTDEPEAEVVRAMLVIPLAEALLEIGDLEAADSVASGELQRLPRALPGMRGNTQYEMNQVRGRVALQRQQRAVAIQFLRRAGQSESTPQLSSYGPRFALARELLQVGEQDAVLRHLDDVERFWTGPDAKRQLAEARRTIRAGGIPDDARWW